MSQSPISHRQIHFQPRQALPARGGSWFSSENKILVIAIAVISIVFLGIGLFIFNKYQSTLDDNYNQFGALLANVVATGGAEKLQSPLSPQAKIETFVDTMLQSSEDIASIEFYDNRGELIYKRKKVLDSDTLKRPIDFSAPMTVQRGDGGFGETIGQVHVKLTGKTLRDITGSNRTLIIFVFISAWLITILSVSANTYVLSKHLRTLVQGVKRLSTGEFGYKINENDLWGELKLLAESFNDMSVRLRVYEEQNLDTITFERNKLEAVLLSIADGVVVCNLEGRISIINQTACSMLAVNKPSQLIGQAIQEYITTEGNTCFKSVIEAFKENPIGFSQSVELPGTTLKVIISSIQDLEGQNLGFVMIMHDMTKEAQVDQLKTNFISNVSHELRTPVTTIKSYVDTIYNHGTELDQDTYREFIETIQVETDRLKKLVNDILDFSRLDEGGVKLETELQDITPIINLTVQSVKVLAQQKNLSMSTAIESGLPKVEINSDCIERVMRNLLSNAIKYTPDGGRVKVRAELSANGDAVEVSVQDTGIGIAEEHIPFIFDRFYRVENAVHTIKGTGLGLHLVKTAIENHHNGEVFVKSEVDHGSTFGFRIFLEEPVQNAKQTNLELPQFH